jgi:hypothetical protein
MSFVAGVSRNEGQAKASKPTFARIGGHAAIARGWNTSSLHWGHSVGLGTFGASAAERARQALRGQRESTSAVTFAGGLFLINVVGATPVAGELSRTPRLE